MMTRAAVFLLLPLLSALTIINAFAPPTAHVGGSGKPRPLERTGRTINANSAGSSTGPRMAAPGATEDKTTLTDETTWRLRLLFNDVATANGRKLDGQLFVVEGSFIEEEGYEPPQGVFKPTSNPSSDDGEEAPGSGTGMALGLTNSRWKLSEDPDDPKDGLWVWGLFKEPLYPYMLLQMETARLALPGDGDDSIPPLKLYARITHVRSEEAGVELKMANLNVRVLERVQLPGASVDLYEEEAVGQVSFQPL